jgi:hypothetical protein
MTHPRFLILAPLFLLPVCVAACSDSVDPDTSPPQVTLSITPYTAVEGFYKVPAVWSDDVGVVKATLLLDGQVAGDLEVATKIIDSTTLTPGLHQVSLQVSDTAGNVAKSAEMPVIFAGQGKVLTYEDVWAASKTPGWSGFDLDVAEDSEGVEDAKAHVDVAAGMNKTMVYFRWSGTTTWTLGFDIGSGECPDSGIKYASKDETGTEGVSEVTYAIDAGLTVGQWFGHVRFTDGINHKGERLHVESLFLVLP